MDLRRGSLTLTNINTDTLVGWNGNQMLLVVWWKLAAEGSWTHSTPKAPIGESLLRGV